ncbi:MAG TPA: TrkA C-terminal domain-containing protein [Bacteroidota bacterium]|nr:TrkA C-terminal domain-containing protein [Bacteroidota bacterium]
MIDFLASSPLLLLFIVVGLGWLAGSVRVFGFSLGPAAVLFVGIFVGSLDPRLRLPELLYVLGLILFVYTIGLQSGPSFFSSFGRRALRANLFAFGAIVLAAILCWAAARAFLLDGLSMVGVFCGALTNTPALAASIEAIKGAPGSGAAPLADLQARTSAPVIGYSVAYPFGVIGVLVAFHVAGKLGIGGGGGKIEPEQASEENPGPLYGRTYRVVNPGVFGKTVASILGDGSHHGFVLSRIRHGEETSLVYGETMLSRDDLVVAVGNVSAHERARVLFGEESGVEIQTENKEFDFRRIDVSDKRVVGKTIRELDLQRLLDATITRVRRGDVDFVPTAGTILERGDRVRVLTWAGNLDRVARFLGDSVRSGSEADFLSLSVGLVLGVLIGIAPLPLPGGGTFTLGFAGGPLIAGLLLGRVQRTGPVTWGMPFSVNLTLRQVGLVLFLAGIGTRAGDGFVQTVEHGGWELMATGGAITALTALLVLAAGSRFLRLSYPSLMGLMSGIQTQPACLAYAAEHGGADAANVWYASVYPVSMIAKIVLAQLLVSRFLAGI